MLPRQRGYTLLEMIVSVGIFSLVMVAATGAYLTLINLDRQARATDDLVTNLSFAVDSMSRAVRTGTGYKCNNSTGTPNCVSNPGASFGFTDGSSPARTIVYSLSGGQVRSSVTVGGVTSVYPLTDPRIIVDSLDFYVRGVGTSGESPKVQPQVTFTIRGTLTMGQGKTASFAIEGGATQRLLEI